jgi:phage/plasmid-like protein (TIGR03299 family)
MTENDQMVAVRDVPWHFGTGTRVNMLEDGQVDVDTILVAAGLDWQVESSPIHRKLEREVEYLDGETTTSVTFPELTGWQMLWRSDTSGVLSVQKDSYTRVQNRESAEILVALLESDKAITFDTGGSVNDGAQCYLTALLDEPFHITGDDSPIHQYAAVTWAHDGSGAVQASSTSVRRVCANTLKAAEIESKRAGTSFTFRHTRNVQDRIADARAVILGLRQDRDGFREFAEELAAIRITDEQREEFILRFVPEPAADVVSPRVRENIRVARQQVRHVFDTATMPDTHRNTAYGLVLAAGEYLDHLRGYRNQDTYLGRTLLRPEPLKGKMITLARKVASGR